MNIVEKFFHGLHAGVSTAAHRCRNGLPQPRASQWCVFVLLLLLPGSFIALPLFWVFRRWTARERSPALLP